MVNDCIEHTSVNTYVAYNDLTCLQICFHSIFKERIATHMQMHDHVCQTIVTETSRTTQLLGLLNQARAGLWPARAWFLEIVSVRTSVCVCVCLCVCPPPRLLITSGVIWTSYNWLNKFYSCYMATVVVIINGNGLGIGTRRRHKPTKN